MNLHADGSRRQILDGAHGKNDCLSAFSVAKFQGVFHVPAVDREDRVKDVDEPEDSRASCRQQDFISEDYTTHTSSLGTSKQLNKMCMTTNQKIWTKARRL